MSKKEEEESSPGLIQTSNSASNLLPIPIPTVYENEDEGNLAAEWPIFNKNLPPAIAPKAKRPPNHKYHLVKSSSVKPQEIPTATKNNVEIVDKIHLTKPPVRRSTSNPDLGAEVAFEGGVEQEKVLSSLDSDTLLNAPNDLPSSIIINPPENIPFNAPNIMLDMLPSISLDALPDFSQIMLKDFEQDKLNGLQDSDEEEKAPEKINGSTSLQMFDSGLVAAQASEHLFSGLLPKPMEDRNPSSFLINDSANENYEPSALPSMPDDFESEENNTHEFKGFDKMTEIEESLVQTCCICEKEIKEKGLFVNGLFYHNDCFKCCKCHERIDQKKCIEYKDEHFCKKCAKALKKPPICCICQRYIVGKKELAQFPEHEPMHKTCVSCFRCGKVIPSGKEMWIEGKLICIQCSKVLRVRVCTICDKIVIGDFVKVRKKYYHPAHYRCEVCDKLITGNNYVLHHNHLLCPEHGDIYRTSCAFCKGGFGFNETDKIKWHHKLYHNSCFVCRVCGCDLNPNEFKAIHGRPHCLTCYEQRKKDGEIDEAGHTIGKHKHLPEKSISRMERFENELERPIIHPQYSKDEESKFEEATPHDPKVWQPTFDNF